MADRRRTSRRGENGSASPDEFHPEAPADPYLKLPPHDIVAEQCLLASMMLDKEVCDQVREIVRGEYFFQTDHQIVFDTISKLRAKNVSIDAVILRGALEKAGLLEDVGGTKYLADILSTVPSAAHGVHYANIVREKAIARYTISVANEMIRDMYAPTNPGDSYLPNVAKAEAKLSRIALSGQVSDIFQIGQAAKEFAAERRKGKPPFVKTGIDPIDVITGGLPVGGFVLIGGRPGAGKSQLCKQIMLNMSISDIRVGIVSVEESRSKIAGNMLSNLSNMRNKHIMTDELEEAELQTLEQYAEGMMDLPFYGADRPTRLGEVCGTIEFMRRQYKIDVAFVDHIHIISADTDEPGNYGKNEVSMISTALKMLGKKLNIPIVAAAQLNRGGGDIKDWIRKPTLRDLRGSGNLEQDADLIILVHREDYYRRFEPDYKPTHVLEGIIAKGKSSDSGTALMFFDADHQRITGLTPAQQMTFSQLASANGKSQGDPLDNMVW